MSQSDSKIVVQVLRGTLLIEGARKSVGDRVSLPVETAERLIQIGQVAALDQAPGYRRVKGKMWIRSKIKMIGETKADVGDVLLVPTQRGLALVDEGHAEVVRSSSDGSKITFRIGA